ncbi:MAG: YIP1 family protein [Syntrophaceae bacterium]|nr:YIP1 family protein [Syntrophaceae bacterium]
MVSYKVIFLGLSVIGPEEESRLLLGLQKKFNLTLGRAESLLQRVPIVVKKGITKEEAERYVRAFEEIGGRVRVEEEIPLNLKMTQEFEPAPRPEPKPESQTTFTPKTEPERKPSTGAMVICPQCGFEQPETNECVKCGIIISKYVQFQEMARSVEGQVREVSKDEYVPWESGEGFIKAFFQTVKGSLFSPISFFKKISFGEGYWSPLIYGLITGIIGNGFSIFWFWLFMARFIPLDRFPFQYGLSILQVIIPLPFQQALAIFIGSGILHLCLMIVRGNHHGYKTTFRAVSYSYSAYLFGIIPFIGLFVGGIYTLILTVIGVREGHGISTGKAILAVLLPVIVVFILIFVAIVLVMMFFGSMGFWGGVRT